MQSKDTTYIYLDNKRNDVLNENFKLGEDIISFINAFPGDYFIASNSREQAIQNIIKNIFENSFFSTNRTVNTFQIFKNNNPDLRTLDNTTIRALWNIAERWKNYTDDYLFETLDKAALNESIKENSPLDGQLKELSQDEALKQLNHRYASVLKNSVSTAINFRRALEKQKQENAQLRENEEAAKKQAEDIGQQLQANSAQLQQTQEEKERLGEIAKKSTEIAQEMEKQFDALQHQNLTRVSPEHAQILNLLKIKKELDDQIGDLNKKSFEQRQETQKLQEEIEGLKLEKEGKELELARIQQDVESEAYEGKKAELVTLEADHAKRSDELKELKETKENLEQEKSTNALRWRRNPQQGEKDIKELQQEIENLEKLKNEGSGKILEIKAEFQKKENSQKYLSEFIEKLDGVLQEKKSKIEEKQLQLDVLTAQINSLEDNLRDLQENVSAQQFSPDIQKLFGNSPERKFQAPASPQPVANITPQVQQEGKDNRTKEDKDRWSKILEIVNDYPHFPLSDAKKLIEKLDNINAVDENGIPIISHILKHSRLEMLVENCIENGADIDSIRDAQNRTLPQQILSRENFYSRMKYLDILIKNSKPITLNNIDKSGSSLLQMIFSEKFKKMKEFKNDHLLNVLAERGADITLAKEMRASAPKSPGEQPPAPPVSIVSAPVQIAKAPPPPPMPGQPGAPAPKIPAAPTKKQPEPVANPAEPDPEPKRQPSPPISAPGGKAPPPPPMPEQPGESVPVVSGNAPEEQGAPAIPPKQPAKGGGGDLMSELQAKFKNNAGKQAPLAPKSPVASPDVSEPQEPALQNPLLTSAIEEPVPQPSGQNPDEKPAPGNQVVSDQQGAVVNILTNPANEKMIRQAKDKTEAERKLDAIRKAKTRGGDSRSTSVSESNEWKTDDLYRPTHAKEEAKEHSSAPKQEPKTPAENVVNNPVGKEAPKVEAKKQAIELGKKKFMKFIKKIAGNPNLTPAKIVPTPKIQAHPNPDAQHNPAADIPPQPLVPPKGKFADGVNQKRELPVPGRSKKEDVIQSNNPGVKALRQGLEGKLSLFPAEPPKSQGGRGGPN